MKIRNENRGHDENETDTIDNANDYDTSSEVDHELDVSNDTILPILLGDSVACSKESSE